jgi:hypothetical protein
MDSQAEGGGGDDRAGTEAREELGAVGEVEENG